MTVSSTRLLACGLLAAALAGLGGGALERWRFGPTDQSAAANVEVLVRREFDRMAGVLTNVASRIANDSSAAQALAAGQEAVPTLFDLLATARADSSRPDDIAVTVYDVNGVARAWSGRPSEFEKDRTKGQQDLFVTRSALGLRLVHLRPIQGSDGGRTGAVAVEHVLSRSTAGAAIATSDELLPTAIAPVSFLPRAEGAGERLSAGSFLLRTPAGTPLVEAIVAVSDLQHARAEWRRHVVAAVLIIAGLTLLLLIGPRLDQRMRTPKARDAVFLTITASMLLVAGTIAIWSGFAWSWADQLGLPANLAFTGVSLAALVALWTVPVTRFQVAYRTRRQTFAQSGALFVFMHLLAGAVVAVFLVSFARVLAVAIDPLAVDVRQFSLYPWNGARVLRLVGILSLQVALIWAATLTLTAARGVWRLQRGAIGSRIMLLSLWLAPTVAATLVAAASTWGIPAFALLTSGVACAVAALLGRRIAAWYRHATVASRIFGLFLTFLVPAVLLYPSLDFFAERAIQGVISREYAVSAQNHSGLLLARLKESQDEIDHFLGLSDLFSDADGDAICSPVGDSRAFDVWRRTALARDRLTSAVELYSPSGCQFSRFALNLPEYTGSGQQPQALSTCGWDSPFAEPLPIGSDERPVLHAERGVCAVDQFTGQRRQVGTIIVHIALDFRTLPFITSQSPYFELLRPNQPGAFRDVSRGNNLRVAIYGWGLQPLYTSGLSAWPIDAGLFQRLYDPARRPFWETIPLGDQTFHVYFTNDRSRIYAIGYPILTLFDHLVHLAEVTTLAGSAFVLVLFATAAFTRLSRERPRVGHALLREIRASFYRKLFLAFVLASTIPVLLLALGIRVYFADLLRNDIQAEAARTASVAQRVIQESDAFFRRGAEGASPLNDDVMIWIRQVIDQDVNVFEGPELVATSERDLFQSGLLPTRTPDDVYRAVALQRLPSFVDEDLLGTFSYLIAATPLRVNSRDYVLTVPLAARQQEIERQKYDLDRGVHLAVLCFILLGAAIGLSLAERIADPVRRLTRASQRIGRGDFDARIAVKSVDELRRLVDAFNSMAEELKAQRVELERTHRLEAWAEMARQVAHEIKNPLTPIQLSAEHLRRVHADRGEPLGTVLDGCVTTILGQVRLLRQIASEFSSFASSPQAKIGSVDLPPLVAEILDPYRAGLEGRIAIENRVAAPLPPVRADRTLILRALANIVENALHAMPGPGQLTVDAAVDADSVTISVRDTGVGMDADALARAFEPYFSTKTSGTGLGLPIARRNVELSGGSIEVDSRKGEGTVVRVRLPRVTDTTTTLADRGLQIAD
jgi:signal transduction histidine kinase